jgi:cytochrome c553
MNSTRHLASWVLFAVISTTGALFASPADAEDLARGEVLYQLCQQCHGAAGEGDAVALAPSIAGQPQWFVEAQLVKFQNGGRGTHFDDLEGMRMRPMSMWLGTQENESTDIADVAAYIAAMPKPTLANTVDGDIEAGKAKYTPCIACHGVNGEGNAALKAPPLAGLSDWYQVRALEKFKAGIRGTNPKDVQGMLMRPMSLTLADDKAIHDVVAYINTLTPAPAE